MRRMLTFCGALAAGEFIVSPASTWAEAWPIAAIAAVLVALLGYGLAARGWPLGFAFLLGVALFLHASVGSEREFRNCPWMRNRAYRGRLVAEERQGLMAAARRDLSRRAAIGISGDRETVALGRAILLGERSRLPLATKRVFVESGTMHVFAISGLHVMTVAQVLVMLMALLFVPRRWAGAVTLPFLWGYVGLIGWTPSAIRAALMATFYLLAPVFWRRPNALRAWALAFLVVHLSSPTMIVNVGNALSFGVMLAIILVGERMRNEPEWKRLLAVTLAAWAAGVPISAHVFGRVTPGGLLANLVLLPAAACTVASGVTGILASFVSVSLAAHLNNLSALLIRAMVGVSRMVSSLPGANFEVARWSYAECAAWYAVIVLSIILLFSLRARRLFG